MRMQQLLLTIAAMLVFLCVGGEAAEAVTTTSDAAGTEPASLPTVFNTRGISYPFARYVEWESLEESVKEDAADLLGYTNATWNIMGTAIIESLSYWTIENTSTTNPNQIDILNGMGIDNETSWDCYVNHYIDYDWDEIVLWAPEAATEGFMVLGWNESSWNGEIPYPDSENKDWHELTVEEVQGAVEVCYLKETWQGLALNNYTNDVGEDFNIVADEDEDGPGESWAVYYAELAMELEALDEIVEQVLEEEKEKDEEDALAIVIGNVDGLVGGGQDGEEGGAPPEVTVVSPSTVATAPDSEDEDEEDSDATTTTTNHPQLPPLPVEVGHYDNHGWNNLPPPVQEAATVLGYDQNSWNSGSAVESENLWWNQLSSEQQAAAKVFGYTEASWNGATPTTVPPQVLLEGNNDYDSNSTLTANSTLVEIVEDIDDMDEEGTEDIDAEGEEGKDDLIALTNYLRNSGMIMEESSSATTTTSWRSYCYCTLASLLLICWRN